MSLSDITRDSVLDAVKECDSLGRESFLDTYGFGPAKSYFLLIDGKKYDSKAIMGVAHKYAKSGNRALRADEFSGGEYNAARRLEKWFTVLRLPRNANGDYPLRPLKTRRHSRVVPRAPRPHESKKVFIEGETLLREMLIHKRNPRLRDEAIDILGTQCKVCGFDFEQTYGSHGRGFIEVHHLRSVRSLAKATKMDPRKDMTVVCSNCHWMIHRKKGKELSLEELRSLLKR